MLELLDVVDHLLLEAGVVIAALRGDLRETLFETLTDSGDALSFGERDLLKQCADLAIREAQTSWSILPSCRRKACSSSTA